MLYVIAVLTAVTAYLLGSINTSIILSRSIYGDDIRSSGSGNAGATNMLRTHGKGIAAATLICDVLKGSVAVILAAVLDVHFTTEAMLSSLFVPGHAYVLGNLKYIAGIFVVLGHDFPLYFKFRGGKGVATSLGVILALNWRIGLIVLAVALLVMIFSRYVSLGSITAAASYPFILFTYLIASGAELADSMEYMAMAFILALILIAKHHSNISKLRSGTENKLFSGKKENRDETEEEKRV